VDALAASGESAAYEKAAAKLEDLGAKRDAANAKAEDARAALESEAYAYDSLRDAAADARDAIADFVAAEREQQAASVATAAAIASSKRAVADAIASSVAKSIAKEEQLKAAAEATMKAIRDSQKGIQDATVANMAKSVAATEKLNVAVKGTGNAAEAAEAFGKIGGPVGKVGQKIFELREGYRKLQNAFGDNAPFLAAAGGIGLVVVAIAAAAIAIGAATLAFGVWAVKQADAARTQELLYAGMTKSAAGGQALAASIGDLAKRVPLSTQELDGLAKKLIAAGHSGKQLEAELESAATAAASAKFGPEWPKQMKSLDQSASRLKANLSSLFGGLKIERLLDSLSYLVDLFDETQVTGQVIKLLFEQIFQPGVDGAATFADKVASAFIQLQIWTLKGLLALAPYRETFILIGDVVTTMIGGAALGLGVLGAQAAVALAGVLIWIDGWRRTMTAVKEGVDWLMAIDLGSVGANMMQGLADGITGGASKVVGALKSAVTGAVDSAKSVLGIKSPSTVLYDEVGAQMSAGVETALDDGRGDVQGALEAAVTPGAGALEAVGAGIATGGAAASPGGGDSRVVYLTVNVGSGAEDSGLARQIADLVSDVIDGDVMQLIGGVPEEVPSGA